MKFNLIKKEKLIIILLCLFMFWSSSTIMIYGGSCDSSPCGGVNDSDAAENGEWITDFSGATANNLFLAPLNFLTPQVLNFVGDYEITPSGEFDQINETITSGTDLPKSDFKPLLIAFFSLKLLTLMNIPLWIILSYLWVKLSRYSDILGALTILLFIVGLTGVKLFMNLGLPNYDENIWDMIKLYFS